MAVKLLALYKKPDDTAAFDDHYFNIHLPLAQKMPGLRHLECQKIVGSPMGKSQYHLLVEMTFDSQADLDAAMSSPEGKTAAKDVMGFAGNLVTLMFSESHATPAQVH